MEDFPGFMRNSANEIDSGFQSAGVDGYVYDGTDGSQMAYWTCHIDGQSQEHVHDFDEYMCVVSGAYTIILQNQSVELKPGEEYCITRNTPHGGSFTAGTRTIHVFGGHRANRKQRPFIQTIQIRPVKEKDLENLREIFNNSISAIPEGIYNKSQIEAWKYFSIDKEKFYNFIFHCRTYVVEKDQEILGFGGIKNNGYINSLYVKGSYQKQGIGSKLIEHLEKFGRENEMKILTVDSSEYAKTLFLKHDFVLDRVENVMVQGIPIKRYAMKKLL